MNKLLILLGLSIGIAVGAPTCNLSFLQSNMASCFADGSHLPTINSQNTNFGLSLAQQTACDQTTLSQSIKALECIFKELKACKEYHVILQAMPPFESLKKMMLNMCAASGIDQTCFTNVDVDELTECAKQKALNLPLDKLLELNEAANNQDPQEQFIQTMCLTFPIVLECISETIDSCNEVTRNFFRDNSNLFYPSACVRDGPGSYIDSKSTEDVDSFFDKDDSSDSSSDKDDSSDSSSDKDDSSSGKSREDYNNKRNLRKNRYEADDGAATLSVSLYITIFLVISHFIKINE